MSTESSLISLVTTKPLVLNKLQQAGVTADHFSEHWDKAYKWIEKMKRQHGRVPSADMIENRYDVELHVVPKRALPLLISQIKDQKKYRDFGDALDSAARAATGPEALDEALAELQGSLNRLALNSDGAKGVVDLFSEEIAKRMRQDYKRRRRGEAKGIPTGLKRFDSIVGGLQKRRMVVVMGRPGLGKSWLDLLFITEAVLSGHKCILFPLEMTLEETAYRLFTMFSNRLYGEDKALRNLDLMMGRVTPRKVVKLLELLEDRFAGQLYVADIGSMNDPYTVERVEAEIQANGPFDMAWVDYITLMKGPLNKDKNEDHTTIKALSNGLVGIGQRNDLVMGASAQVNREAIKGRSFLPRVENIAYGDAIGQDAAQVVSINRRGEHLFYAVVKNRFGPEIGRTRVRFFVDRGSIHETAEQPEEDEDS